jgi:hypothetical protein
MWHGGRVVVAHAAGRRFSAKKLAALTASSRAEVEARYADGDPDVVRMLSN